MKPHWAIKDIEQTVTGTGYKIVVTTFTPCHLWMRWTTTEPQEHIIPVIRRGIALHGSKRFCFVVFEDNEQEEPGDTLEHTFIKEPWPVCETRYFYFYGTVCGLSSPSTTAIFKKHRVAPPFGPPVWIGCSLSDLPVNIGARDPDWNIVQTKDPYFNASNPFMQIFTSWRFAQHYIRRQAFMFDTSPIPSGSQIVQAHFWWYESWMDFGPGPHEDCRVRILDAITWDGSIDPSWYAIWNTFTSLCCEYTIPKDAPYACRIHYLNETGLTKIVPAGHTKYLMETQQDLDNEDPGLTCRSSTIQTEKIYCPAQLFVQYRPPL